MEINRLTAARVGSLKEPGLYPDGNNLWLQVRPGAGDAISKSWIFRYRFGGKHRAMGLGSTRWMDLKEARDAARESLRILKVEGVDPLERREAIAAEKAAEAKKVITFKQAAERYIKAHADTWKNPAHAAQWPATLQTYAYPHFGETSVAAVDLSLVLKAIEPIWSTKPETASRVRGRIEAVLDWAAVREAPHGMRPRENPARWKGHLDKLLPARGKVQKVRPQPALPYTVINAFMADLQARQGVGALALEFLILTGVRSGNVTAADWSEVDLKAATWTIPANKMKAEREHKVPLSARALEILTTLHEARADDAAVVFSDNGNALSDMTLSAVIKRMNTPNAIWVDPKQDARPVVPHGFRSTFRTWTEERSNFGRNVAEAALAHTLGDKVEAAYNRGDLFAKRKQLMEAWSRYCATPAPVEGDNVRSIGGAQP